MTVTAPPPPRRFACQRRHHRPAGAGVAIPHAPVAPPHDTTSTRCSPTSPLPKVNDIATSAASRVACHHRCQTVASARLPPVRMLTPPRGAIPQVAPPAPPPRCRLHRKRPRRPRRRLPVVSAMSPLTPEEPELAVAIVMEPESSEVPTPLVTLTAPPVLAPTPPAMDTAPPTAPLLPSPMPAVSVSAPPAALSAVVLPAVTVTAPPAPVLPSPTLREIAPPRRQSRCPSPP